MICNWGNCSIESDINSKTGKYYYYCGYHRKKRIISCSESYKKRKYEHLKQGKEYRKNLRKKFFEIYGSICVICDINFEPVLTLDHVNNDGKIERGYKNGKATRNSYTAYINAIRKFQPNKYQVLCMNCNFVKGIGRLKELIMLMDLCKFL